MAGKHFLTKEVMKLGGSEVGWVGSADNWAIKFSLKVLAVAGSEKGDWELVGEPDELPGDVLPECEGCARGVLLSVYMVRRGIS